MQNQPGLTKIDVISGFLGAGKTTLIKKIISNLGKNEKIVLIENEFGKIGIDKSFVQDTGIEIKELFSGCICCTLIGDFTKAISELIESHSPDRILIEPSGIVKLSAFLADLNNKDYFKNIQINHCVTIVDASKFHKFITAFGDFYKDQIENADSLILRAGNTDDETKKCYEMIHELNPDATIIQTSWDEIDFSNLLNQCAESHIDDDGNPCTCCHGHHHHTPKHDHDLFSNVGFEVAKLFKKEDLQAILNTLCNDVKYDNVIRAKGIVASKNGKGYQFDYTKGEYEIRDCSLPESTQVCVIGTEVKEKVVMPLFK